jgi:hypothetical protein
MAKIKPSQTKRIRSVSRKDVLALIDAYRLRSENYHDQKERMAYAIVLLVSGFGGAFFVDNEPPAWVFSDWLVFTLFLLAILWLWACAHFVLCFQLKAKRIAAIHVSALMYAQVDAHSSTANWSFGDEPIQQPTSGSNWFVPILNTMLLSKSAYRVSGWVTGFKHSFLQSAYARAIKEHSSSTQVERVTWLLSVWVLLVVLSKTIVLLLGGS